MSIAPGSPAAVAGLQVGDTIVGFDGAAVTGVDALHRLLTADRAGKQTELSVLRLTQKLTLPIMPGGAARCRLVGAAVEQGDVDAAVLVAVLEAELVGRVHDHAVEDRGPIAAIGHW